MLRVDGNGLATGILSDTMCSFISFRKSTPPQNRQLGILIGKSKPYVHDFVGELIFKNQLINTFCEIRFLCDSNLGWALINLRPARMTNLSHTTSFYSRFAEVKFSTNPSTYHVLLLK